MRDVDFLFVYEVRNREMDAVCLVGAYLEEKGYRVGYINTWDSLYHFQRRYDASVVILSACYDDKTYRYFTGHARSFEKAVNLQWEQVLMNGVTRENAKTDWDFSGEMPAETRHICWGENNRQYLMRRYGFPENNLRVCGYLPLDFYRPEFRNATMKREALFTKHGLDPAKRTVLFISSFADLGKPAAEQAVLADDGLDEAENIRLQNTSQRIILDWFRRLAAEEKDLRIVYRPHPAEADNAALRQCEKEISNFHVIGEESIRNWIMNCDILCNWKSTSMIETFAAGKKTLILHPTEIPFALNMPFFREGHYRAVHTYEELLAGIQEEDAEYPMEKEQLLQFYSITDEPAYRRVGDELIRTLEDSGYHSRDLNRKHSDLYVLAGVAKNRVIAGVSGGLYRTLNRFPRRGGSRSPLSRLRARCEHYDYYVRKARQNRMPKEEWRARVDLFREMIRKDMAKDI